jgi:hypothetical protein
VFKRRNYTGLKKALATKAQDTKATNENARKSIGTRDGGVACGNADDDAAVRLKATGRVWNRFAIGFILDGQQPTSGYHRAA